ncbi:MAG: DUF4157 domain-containing protein [Pseudonocardiaceae bacterium]
MTERTLERAPAAGAPPPMRPARPAAARSFARPRVAGHELVAVADRRARDMQAKIEVGLSGDPREREADRVAEQVMRTPEPESQPRSATSTGGGGVAPPIVHEALRSPGAPLDPTARDVPPIAREALRSPGQPLDPEGREFMERRFGHDFSKVRVHADREAAKSAQALDALAYTVGRHVVFGPDRYEPHIERGRRLLAHELAHVIQQRTEGEPAGELEMARRDDPSEVEAERAANAALAGGRMVALHPANGLLQRQDGDSQRTLDGGSASGAAVAVPAGSRWPFSPLPIPAEIAASYVDDRTVTVAVKLALGTVFLTLEGGARIELPLADFRETSYNLVPIFPVADTKDEARALFPQTEMDRIGLTVCAFYRDPTGVVVPTVLNEQTLPRVVPTFRRALEADRAGVAAAEKTAIGLLLWYIGARLPVRATGPKTAAPTAGALESLTPLQRTIASEAQMILRSKEFTQLRAAQAAGESAEVVIGGRTILYEPGLNASGMTLFGENGFIIGREAFKSGEELTKTLLHELHRLATTASKVEGVGGALAAEETAAAASFADDLWALGVKLGMW